MKYSSVRRTGFLENWIFLLRKKTRVSSDQKHFEGQLFILIKHTTNIVTDQIKVLLHWVLSEGAAATSLAEGLFLSCVDWWAVYLICSMSCPLLAAAVSSFCSILPFCFSRTSFSLVSFYFLMFSTFSRCFCTLLLFSSILWVLFSSCSLISLLTLALRSSFLFSLCSLL